MHQSTSITSERQPGFWKKKERESHLCDSWEAQVNNRKRYKTHTQPQRNSFSNKKPPPGKTEKETERVEESKKSMCFLRTRNSGPLDRETESELGSFTVVDVHRLCPRCSQASCKDTDPKRDQQQLAAAQQLLHYQQQEQLSQEKKRIKEMNIVNSAKERGTFAGVVLAAVGCFYVALLWDFFYGHHWFLAGLGVFLKLSCGVTRRLHDSTCNSLATTSSGHCASLSLALAHITLCFWSSCQSQGWAWGRRRGRGKPWLLPNLSLSPLLPQMWGCANAPAISSCNCHIRYVQCSASSMLLTWANLSLLSGALFLLPFFLLCIWSASALPSVPEW